MIPKQKQHRGSLFIREESIMRQIIIASYIMSSSSSSYRYASHSHRYLRWLWLCTSEPERRPLVFLRILGENGAPMFFQANVARPCKNLLSSLKIQKISSMGLEKGCREAGIFYSVVQCSDGHVSCRQATVRAPTVPYGNRSFVRFHFSSQMGRS